MAKHSGESGRNLSLPGALVLGALVLGALMLPRVASGQEAATRGESVSDVPNGFFFGAFGASFVPFGTWTHHPLAGENVGGVAYPADLSQFGPGFGGRLELGWKTKGRLFWILDAELTSLATDEWENFANLHGPQISASASQWSIVATLEIETFRSSPFHVDTRLGLGYMQAAGEEEIPLYGLTYDYGFLDPAFTLRAGLGAGWVLNRRFELALLGDFLVGMPGVSDPYSGSYLGFAFSAGVRWWPSPRS